MSESHDVVIVGAGVVGCSIAAQLAERSAAMRIAVIDRHAAPGMGSTARAAGGVRAQFGSAVDIDLSLASIAMFERIADAVELRQSGYLFVTASERGAAALDEVATIQRARGVPVVRLDRAQVAAKAPHVAVDDVIAASFSATDGYLDPHGVCSHFAAGARARGVELVLGRAVTRVEPDRVALDDGRELRAGAVVLAAGHWSGALARASGLELPVVPERHHLALSGPVANVAGTPMVVDLDTGFHCRPEGAGLLVGYPDRTSFACAGSIDEPPPQDGGFFERVAEVALVRAPSLDAAGLDRRRSWAGWYATTPDQHAIIGTMNGIVIATGFGGHGVMHSPAVGAAVADLLLGGECRRIDLRPLRPLRFAEGDLCGGSLSI